MGKPTGFMEVDRVVSDSVEPLDRIKNFEEFHFPLSTLEQSLQASRCMDCGVAFCQGNEMIQGMMSGCPLGNLIPEVNDLLSKGLWKQAYQRLSITHNFPEFTSRVCPALCEVACTCGLNQEAVCTKENEGAIIEKAFQEGWVDSLVSTRRTGKKIAVIGSGPSGLAAADQLIKRGHEVTIYEQNDRFGGLLMYGIPNMKLDKSIIDRRISMMKKSGINFISNVKVGADIDKETLMNEYDAIILACGASKPRDIIAPSRDAKGIYFAVDYLTQATKAHLNHAPVEKEMNAFGKNVVIIGGGDTGNDCVATSIRQGCNSVTQLEMMSKPPLHRLDSNPWPQWPKILKTDYGQEEAIALFGEDPRLFETTVSSYIKNEQGQLTGIEIVSVYFEKDEGSHRMMMKTREETKQILDCDIILIAAGFIGANPELASAFNLKLDERGNIATSHHYQTEQNKIYVTGDMRKGQSLVVWAIDEGRKVAKQVDQDLMK